MNSRLPWRYLPCPVCSCSLALSESRSGSGRSPFVRTSSLIFPDNLGWGEVGAYGSVRGPLTPRIDKMAAEGIRLNNFNVEYSCTVSRAALMTGRYAIRTGATQPGGITLWEVTLAEALKSVGYATALFGKWHLGGDRARRDVNRRRRASTSTTASRARATRRRPPSPKARRRPNTSFIWEGKAGEPPRNVKPFNMDTRRTIDRESVERGIAFMERHARERRPFFLYYPMTQIHFPTLAHADFAGKIGRRRRRRRDGRNGRQRRPRARRHRQAAASRATRSCCGAPTTAPSSAARGEGRRGHGRASTTA